MVVNFTLKDGSNWYYLYGGFQGCWSGFYKVISAEYFQVPGYPGNWFGEGFNAQVRSGGAQKLAFVDFNNAQTSAGADESACPPVP